MTMIALSSCELLSIYYFCIGKNNFLINYYNVAIVVNCFQFIIFA